MIQQITVKILANLQQSVKYKIQQPQNEGKKNNKQNISMYKQTIDIWIATHAMFTQQHVYSQINNSNLHPFCFKDVRLRDSIYDLYKFAKSVRLISDGVDLSHCFYFVQVKHQQNQSQKEDIRNANTMMTDEKQQNLQYQLQRQEIYQQIMKDATIQGKSRIDFSDFNISIKKLLKYKLGDSYKNQEKRKNIYMRIYIMWKQASFQLRNNPRKVITLPVLKTQTFDQLYRRALYQCPQLHQNIRMIIYKCGPDKQEVYLTKHRVYEQNHIMKEEAKKIQYPQSSQFQLQKRAFKIRDPNGEIYQIGEVYRFRLFNLNN